MEWKFTPASGIGPSRRPNLTLCTRKEAAVPSEFAFVVAGRLSELTGGQLFNLRLIEGLRQSGRVVRAIELADPDAKAQLKALQDGTTAVLDEVTLPEVADLVPRLAERLRLVAFVHHPISEEYGSPSAELL